MNKLFTKIAALSVGLAMAVGVGVAVGSGVKAAKAAEYTELECDFTLKTTSHGNYNSKDDDGGYWAYNEDFTVFSGANNNGQWAYVKMGGKSDYMADYNPVFIKTTTATTHATTKVEVNILKNDNKNVGKMSATWKLIVASDSDFENVVEEVDKGSLDLKTAKLYTFDSDGSPWPAGCYYKIEWTCTNTSTANGIAWLDSIKVKYEVSAVTPDTIVVSGDSNVSIGETTNFSAVAKKSGSTEGVDQNVVWSSNDVNVAVVSSTGVVTGVHNGTATIRAAAKEDGSVYGEKMITVTDGKDDDSALVLVPDSFPAAYGDAYITASGVYLHAKQIMKNDGMIQIQKTNGLLETVSAFDDEIATIELSFNSGKAQGTGYTVQASSDGESYDNLESEQYKDAYHLVYDVPAGKYFFKITGPTANTLYLDEILIGFGNSDETKLVALANTLNGLLDGECEGADDKSAISAEKWADVADAFDDGDAGAKSMLEAVGSSKSYQSVNLFLARYDHIVSAYGYNNFLSREYASETIRNFTTVDNGTSTIIIIVASIVTMSSFAFVLLLRKKKHMK